MRVATVARRSTNETGPVNHDGGERDQTVSETETRWQKMNRCSQSWAVGPLSRLICFLV